MLTHKQFVEMIYDNSNDYTCPLKDCDVSTCETCAERIATAYEDKIRADERRKFAEWICKNNVGIVDFDNDEWKIKIIYRGADYAITEYEKEVTKNE